MSVNTYIAGYKPGTWTIDPVHSHIEFAIKHMMVSKARGRFTTFRGTITTADNPLESTVSVIIDAGSINTDNETRDDHIRSADFFAVASNPTITFVSTAVRAKEDGYLIDGDLTIRGVTKPVTLSMQLPEFGSGPDGGYKAGFSATGEINRSDFGISYNGPIPGGGVAIGEKAQIVLEMEADLRPDS